MADNFILYDINDIGVTTLTLNRVEKRNSFNPQFIKQLTTLLLYAERDPATRVIMIAANGPVFCAGADINWMQDMIRYSKEENLKDARHLSDLMYTLNKLTKPTIALVQGPAHGGGVGIVACCDVAIATTEASFSFSEVKWGIIPAVISPYCIAAIGERAARRYFTTAEPISAVQAHQLGLVHEITDDLHLAGMKIAQTLQHNGPRSIAAAKQLIEYVTHHPIDEALQMNLIDRIASIRITEEAQEGLHAFLEKRKPSWMK